MTLDFTTLFVVILLNAAGFALVWATVSLSYRSVLAARYWFAAMLMSACSGPFLVHGSQLLSCVGILFTVASFSLIWAGIRSLDGHKPNWPVIGLILVVSAVAMVLLGGTRETNNVIFALSQLVPMILSIHALLMLARRSAGVWVSVAAAGVFVLGQGMEALTNLLCIAGIMSTQAYYAIAPWFLVCAIIGCTALNLGMFLIVTDRLRAELYSLATRDDLTGLPNRRALRERIELEESSARRRNSTVALMMIDLDKFKQINDRYGHDAGDDALRQLARLMRSCIRDIDFLARVGGDEFCVIMPDTDLALAQSMADVLVKAVSDHNFMWRGREVTMTTSVGVTEWSPQSRTGLADAILHADSAMFGSKREAQRDEDHSIPTVAAHQMG